MAASLCLALTLSACAGAPVSEPTPSVTQSREVASAYRCLADHSPWTLDLDTIYREWYEAAAREHELDGGAVTGTAELIFTRGPDPSWTFTASGVTFELFFSGGGRESTAYMRELRGRYAVPEPGGVLALTSVRAVETVTDAASVAEDGTRTAGTSVAAPLFPWDAEPGTLLAMTCTEHRLVVSVPDATPETWDLSPG
ncbi:MAG: hypothetical protein ACTHMQ_10355 [Protaetiibacter sp.]